MKCTGICTGSHLVADAQYTNTRAVGSRCSGVWGLAQALRAMRAGIEPPTFGLVDDR